MKKLTVLSIMAASFILVGCGDSATGAEAKAAAEHKTETTMKCGEGKCGAAMKKEAAQKAEEAAKETKTAATEAKEAATKAVEKATEAAKETAAEATAAVKETAAAATAAVKEKAAAAADAAKEAATSAVDSAKAAAASATAAATGPDGKALFAKCSGCHGADGKTAAMGKSALLNGQSAADLETKINEYKAGTRNVAGMGALMKGQVAALSDADVKAIAAYVSGL